MLLADPESGRRQDMFAASEPASGRGVGQRCTEVDLRCVSSPTCKFNMHEDSNLHFSENIVLFS